MRATFRLFAALVALLCLAQPALAAEPPFPTQLEAVFSRAKQSMMSDPEAARRELATAESLARNIADTRQRALALATARWLGAEAYLRNNAPEKAGPMLAQGLKMIEPIAEPIKLRGDLLMSQGAWLMQSDKAAQALKNFQDAFEIFGKVDQPRSQAIALQNIALLYTEANDNQSAEKYLAQAARTYGGDQALSVSLHNNRGNVLMSLERYGDAETEYAEGVRIARAMSDPLLEAWVLGNLARNQVEARKFDAAQATLDRGFALTRQGDSSSRRYLFATSARLAAGRGDFARAEQLIRECFTGLDLSETSVDFRTAHLYAYQIFRETGDLRAALTHLEALRRLSDEAAKVATTTSAQLMAAKFDYQGQQLQIERLGREQERKTAEFQRTLFLGLGIATLIVIAALAWGLITVRRSRNKVAAANIVLAETNVALEKALKAKTEFLATTSHEIRTPLNGILGMTQVMLSDAKLEAQMRDRIGIVHSAGITMRALVDDILDVAKIETGNLTVDAAPMDVCALLRDVTRMWEEQATAKGLSFRLELSHAPCWIVSDSGRLRQIVFNLLSNAIKFTEKGGVTVRAIDEGEGDDRRLKLVIADTGIGIPADKFADIFESFRQVDTSTTRKFGGTGLGLTICRNLAQALGGDVQVESEEGAGSRFILDIPLVPAEAPDTAEAGAAGSGASLLIVDRNPIARSMLKTLFEPRTATLRFAGSAEEGLAMLQANAATHLLIDEGTAKAGEGDPLEMIRTFAAAAPDARSFVLWAKPDEDIRSQLLAAGIEEIIEKPVSGASLVDAVVPYVEQNSATGIADPLATRAA